MSQQLLMLNVASWVPPVLPFESYRWRGTLRDLNMIANFPLIGLVTHGSEQHTPFCKSPARLLFLLLPKQAGDGAYRIRALASDLGCNGILDGAASQGANIGNEAGIGRCALDHEGNRA